MDTSLLLCIRVPADVSRLLQEIEIPEGERSDPSDLHITLTYTKEGSVQAMGSMIATLLEALKGTAPFPVYTSRIGTFPATPHSDGKIPLICKVDSNELHSLRAKIVNAFDNEGVDYSKNFPEYRPHLTLAYLEDRGQVHDDWSDHRIPTLSFGVNALTILLGWQGRVVEVTVPLHLQKTAAQRLRVISRYLQCPGSTS